MDLFGLLRLFAQIRCCPMFIGISLLHVRRPKRCAYSVGESKKNRTNRYKLEKNSGNTEAIRRER